MNSYILKNAYPASRWNDATPTGSGIVGACVYGKLADERILLNHERFWFHGRSEVLPNVSDYLPELRKMMLDGHYRKAQSFLPDKIREQGYNAAVAAYMPGFDLRIITHTDNAFSDYERRLDMSSGEVTVAWKSGETSFRRKLFVSRADNNIAVLKIEADRAGSVNCRFSLEPHDLLDAYHYGGASFTVDNNYTASADGNFLTVMGRTADGFEFSAAARVYPQGGTLCTRGDGIEVKNADSVTLLTALIPDGDTAKALAAADSAEHDYDSLFERHVAVFGAEFLRSVLQLTPESDNDREKSNEQLLLDAYGSHPSTALIERMYNFSRFLLLCSSVPGGLPAGLQGIWNGDYEPPWCAAFFYNENIELSYWQALPCNNAEAMLPLFDLLEKQLPDFRENARKLYGCRGIFVPLYADENSGIIRDLQPQVIYWTAGAGWLARHFYDYYLYTADLEFLKNRAVPFMKEAALFYEDFLITGDDGYLMSLPADSPENTANGSFYGAGETAICINPTMDFAVVKDLLTNLCDACEKLDTERDMLPIWQDMLNHIPPYKINGDGALCEWMHPDFSDNYQHRHQSHIYPAFPGTEIIKECSPQLYAAAKTAVEKRLVIGLKEQTGWSFSHMANIFGRMEDGKRALECLEHLLGSCTGTNLFTYINDWRDMGVSMQMIWGIKPPMQLDAALGYAGAVTEMLLFSTPELVRILPALPDKWKSGSFNHFRTRNGLDISVSWSRTDEIIEIDFTADRDSDFTLKLPEFAYPYESSVKSENSPFGIYYHKISVKAGGLYHIVCSWKQ